ncbi:type II toxin-antitoxin system Phd/YefM family antitoxin [Demequina soli]|uniref:type II toxin-antitoxin system Phd/YefM family antitoxin n=1 Tax=Demequina soli TaxID=1638987 RepID=UPI00078550CC|nr:type II toxin-antitoxin system prevent-host-death family antitoxin [Demequina soli]
MRTVNIHEAKTQLSRLVAATEGGETIVIARAGVPVARLVPVDAPATPARVGFLAATIPDDFDDWGVDDAVALFEGR